MDQKNKKNQPNQVMDQQNKKDQPNQVVEPPLEKMTEDDARRIQSHADKTGTNQEFKSRAMKAAAKNQKKA